MLPKKNMQKLYNNHYMAVSQTTIKGKKWLTNIFLESFKTLCHYYYFGAAVDLSSVFSLMALLL